MAPTPTDPSPPQAGQCPGASNLVGGAAPARDALVAAPSAELKWRASLGMFAHPSPPHCSILFSQTDRAFGGPHEAWPRWRFPGARNEPHRHSLVIKMTHGGQKGFGMTRHGRSGHASPCRSSRHRRTIARTALGSRTRNSLPKSYFIPGRQYEPDEIPKQQSEDAILQTGLWPGWGRSPAFSPTAMPTRLCATWHGRCFPS